MEKVLILGNKGMLGHVIFQQLSAKLFVEKYDVFGINRADDNSYNKSYKLDALNLNDLKEFIKNKEPQYIINCIGTLVEHSNNNPIVAIQTNSLLPHFLDDISNEFNFKLIHISTDCVFNGRKGKYIESDIKNETNYYGLTKSLGEINNSKNLTIRTSIIGPEIKLKPIGLFNWIMSQKGKAVSGYSNVIWGGLTTIELSKFIIWTLDKELSGIVHATNSISISKFDLIKLIDEIFNLNISINKFEDHKNDKSLLNTKINTYDFPSYVHMIKEMKSWIDIRAEYKF